jgi:peptide/nickel transport system ATP-binding protein
MSMERNNNGTLIEINGLKMHFPIKAGPFSEAKVVRAIDNVSLQIPKRSVFGLVGESGSGKTTIGPLHFAIDRAHGWADSL